MKSKSLILMIVSLGFGLIAAVGISQVMGRNNSQQPALQTGPVVVPSEDLSVGALLTEENCKILDYPVRLIPEGAITSMEQIKEMATRGRLLKEMPIMVNQIVHKNKQDVLAIPKGKKVCSIKVSAADTIDGLLRPGDRIDLIGIFKIRKNQQNMTTAKTFLKNITVFAAGGKLSNEGRREAGSGKNSIISVLVTPQQAEMLLLVQKAAKLSVVLRGPEAQDEPEGSADDDFLAKFFKGEGFDDDKGDDVKANSGGNMQDFFTKALANAQSQKKTKKMRIWVGSEPTNYVFGSEGDLPTSDAKPKTEPGLPSDTPVGTPPGTAPGAPGTTGAGGYGETPGTYPASPVSNSNGSNGFNRSPGIDRSLEEDQYPGE